MTTREIIILCGIGAGIVGAWFTMKGVVASVKGWIEKDGKPHVADTVIHNVTPTPSKELCDERHHTIDGNIAEIKTTQAAIFKELGKVRDQIIDVIKNGG